MKVSGPPTIDPGQRLDHSPGVKSLRPAAVPETMMAGLLEPGRLLRGKVVSIEGAGLFTIATELGSFKAASASILAVGREFWFQVVQGGASPLLAEAGKTNAVLNLLRVLLPGMIAADGMELGSLPLPEGDGQEVSQDAATRLLRFLAANAVDGRPDPGKLLKTISHLDLSRPLDGTRAGGQPQEALALLRDLDSPAALKLTRLLEAHGAVNQQPPPSGSQSDYYLFPVFFAEQAGRGEWLFSFEREGGGADAAATAISFYLTMSQLGDIHLKIAAQANALTGVFTLTTDDAADHVRQHLPQLNEALRPLADKVVISCRTAKFDCLKTLKEELTDKVGLEERFALVDVKA